MGESFILSHGVWRYSPLRCDARMGKNEMVCVNRCIYKWQLAIEPGMGLGFN